jgi:hypothetical protein
LNDFLYPSKFEKTELFLDITEKSNILGFIREGN